jgi:hypothetical protein
MIHAWDFFSQRQSNEIQPIALLGREKKSHNHVNLFVFSQVFASWGFTFCWNNMILQGIPNCFMHDVASACVAMKHD